MRSASFFLLLPNETGAQMSFRTDGSPLRRCALAPVLSPRARRCRRPNRAQVLETAGHVTVYVLDQNVMQWVRARCCSLPRPIAARAAGIAEAVRPSTRPRRSGGISRARCSS